MHTQCREEIETSANCCRSPKWGKSYRSCHISYKWYCSPLEGT